MGFIERSLDVNELPPEELAAVVLRDLHVLADNQRRDPPIFSIGSYCVGESDQYQRTGQQDCKHALAAAWGHLVASGMLAADSEQSTYGWYFLTPRARKIKTDADYRHFRHVSLYPVTTIHPAIREETYSEFL